VTSTSSGTPSKEGTRSPVQKRTPSCGAHARSNGAGGAAVADAGRAAVTSRAASSVRIVGQRTRALRGGAPVAGASGA
jgi:hypothetical protein